ncbi:hypothetical protein BD408DRAFT_438757 [Parasitella parasitica]|nr:hypothetical protein BD408DRAFT_438757 [Parasitella parasitica]
MLIEAQEVDENLDIPNLPLKWKSNTNLIAQLLLNNQEIINLIVQVLVGTHIPKNSFVVHQAGWPETEGIFKVYILSE